MTVQKKLGQRIRFLRELKGFTQESFEDVSRLSPQYLSALERGTKNVTLEVLERVANGLGVELFVLFLFDAPSERPTKRAVEKLLGSMPEERAGQALQIIQILQQPSKA